MNLTKELWGIYEEQDIYLLKLKNDSIQVTLSNFGAVITSIITPDHHGHQNNIVLGYDSMDEYIDDKFYTGCIIGRFAGRIADAQFSIGGFSYTLAQNDDNNIHLHGGNKGFSKRAFTVTNETITGNSVSVEFYYRSRHLEEGYPGNLDVWVTYTLSANNHLTIDYKAITDRDTHINLTNHSYFNLSGKTRSALDHQLFIDADNYLATNKNYIPTGNIEPVDNTPYDFKTPRTIASNMTGLSGLGYNECYVLNKNTNGPCASLSDDVSGRKITIETDMPALLFYSGDYLDGKLLHDSGVCLETQFFPDAPNHSDFPETLLRAGEEWKSYTRFTFT